MFNMKRIQFTVVSFLLMITVFIAFPSSANERAEILPKASDNLQCSKLIKNSYFVNTNDGYLRVFNEYDKIYVEHYDKAFSILNRKTLDLELDIWGGFYAGSDAYYIVSGSNNTGEYNEAEVIRVTKYDKNWNRLDAAQITSNPALFGGEVRYPFNYGCVEFAEMNGVLYIVTGHEGYVDASVGQGHQGLLMIAVDESSMTGQIVKCDLWHSLAQYIETDDSYIYLLEQSEGSRCTTLKQIEPGSLSTNSISVLDYGGSRTSSWAIACYSSVNDLAVSSDNILCLGTSIDQSQYDEVTQDTAHNIYLTVTSKENFSQDATTVKWLTDYVGGGQSFVGLNITKINDDRFMIAWEKTDTQSEASIDDPLCGYIFNYAFIDGYGNLISDIFTANAPLSACHPIVDENKIVYFASSANCVNFYTIDTITGDLGKRTYRVAGECVSWEINDGILTLSGTGAIEVNNNVNYRYPLSSCDTWYSYSDQDNAWKPVRESVTKIVVNDGITSISEGAFKGFSNLTEAEIGRDVKSIGNMAFSYIVSLRKLVLNAPDTILGEDVLWTGYLWNHNNAHVVYASIYGYEGTPAEQYAKTNGISYEYIYGKWVLEQKQWVYYRGREKAAGWIQDHGKWYYLDNTGVMQTGWHKDGNTWYYLTSSGAMQTGWQSVGGTWYYFKDSGAMVTGWQSVGGTWYYFKDSGAMVTGWQKVGSTWYFFKSSGAMAANEWCEGYWLNADGSWTYQPKGSWKQDSKGWWFGDTSGWYAKNSTVKIDNVNYKFNASGYWVK